MTGLFGIWVSGLLSVEGKAGVGQTLQVGDNPADMFFSLPKGSQWSGEGNFTYTHFIYDTPRDNKEVCRSSAESKSCVREISRSLLVERGRFQFKSHCKFEDCNARIHIPSEAGLTIKLADIHAGPLLLYDIKSPFRINGYCSPTTINMYVPGREYSVVNHYSLFLKVNTYHTFQDSSGQINYEATIKARIVLDDGTCDSFMSHGL